MTKSERRMTKKLECSNDNAIRHSFVIRHSRFVILLHLWQKKNRVALVENSAT
jgi:phage-related protein